MEQLIGVGMLGLAVGVVLGAWVVCAAQAGTRAARQVTARSLAPRRRR